MRFLVDKLLIGHIIKSFLFTSAVIFLNVPNKSFVLLLNAWSRCFKSRLNHDSFYLFITSLLLTRLSFTSHLFPSLELFVIDDIAKHFQLFMDSHVSYDILNIACSHFFKYLSWHLFLFLLLNLGLFFTQDLFDYLLFSLNIVSFFLWSRCYIKVSKYFCLLNIGFEFLIFTMIMSNTMLVFRHWWII